MIEIPERKFPCETRQITICTHVKPLAKQAPYANYFKSPQVHVMPM